LTLFKVTPRVLFVFSRFLVRFAVLRYLFNKNCSFQNKHCEI
jgi:hypothetical protein